MTLSDFWINTDATQDAASLVVRADTRLDQVYTHARVLESWRHHLLSTRLATGAPFWYEAQNDYLLSLVHAGRGTWRSALQALRSFLENAAGSLYYMDHPVEARRFDRGDFRLSWTETKQYFATYPYVSDAAFRISTWEQLAHEYAELSKAVHGSAESFRMTESQRFPVLCSSDQVRIGAWRTRCISSAKAIHLLLMIHFASELAGARLRGLREDLGGVFSARDKSRVRQSLGIVLPTT